MLKTIKDHLLRESRPQYKTDDNQGERARQFGDSFADNIDWHPLTPGGSTYQTHTLERTSEDTLILHPVKSLRWAPWFVLGFIPIAGGIPFAFFTPLISLPILVACALVLSIVAWRLLQQQLKTHQFNTTEGSIWTGTSTTASIAKATQRPDYLSLSDVHALQIVCEYVKSNDLSGPFLSYELNLVLNDKNRRNLMDHHDLSDLRHDAQQLADALKVPLWDDSLHKDN